jgi:c-di-GMP-binding flagellar brake protein YcgR
MVDRVMQEERRKHRRVRVPLLVQYRFSPLAELRTDYATDVSEGGIFIATSEPVLPGTPVQLQFFTREDLELINAEGRVTRSTPEGQGVQFARVAPEDVPRLAAFIARVRERQRTTPPG